MQCSLIGVAGLGFLGRGIALCLLNHGFDVIALETDANALAAAPQSGRMTLASTVAEMAGCHFVIESIIENLPAKQELFRQLEQVLGAAVPIVTNTSAIPITLLQTGLQHPNRFAGMHWTAPAEATRFLEIIRGDHTDDATVNAVAGLARQLSKDPAIVQKDVPGFVANRIAYAMYREAVSLVEQGVADAETIDKLCQHSLGLWTPLCGPFRWMDITGGPTLYATAMERIVPTLNNAAEVQTTMRQMQRDDCRGTRNGRGFYSYAPGDAATWQSKLQRHALRIWEIFKD